MAKGAVAKPTNGLQKYFVGVAIVGTVVLAVQTVTLAVWCGSISTRVETVETHSHAHVDMTGIISVVNP